jgi:hypothetical protein
VDRDSIERLTSFLQWFVILNENSKRLSQMTNLSCKNRNRSLSILKENKQAMHNKTE